MVSSSEALLILVSVLLLSVLEASQEFPHPRACPQVAEPWRKEPNTLPFTRYCWSSF